MSICLLTSGSTCTIWKPAICKFMCIFKNKQTNKTLSLELAQKLNFLSFQSFILQWGKDKKRKEKTATLTSSWTHAKQTNYFCFGAQNTNACDRAGMRERRKNAFFSLWRVSHVTPTFSFLMVWLQRTRGNSANWTVQMMHLSCCCYCRCCSRAVKYLHAELRWNSDVLHSSASNRRRHHTASRPGAEMSRRGYQTSRTAILRSREEAELAKYNKIILCLTLFFAQASPSWLSESYF